MDAQPLAYSITVVPVGPELEIPGRLAPDGWDGLDGSPIPLSRFQPLLKAHPFELHYYFL
jgi:hypothetical protein